MAQDDPGRWPYLRDAPDVVVLGVRPGAAPSPRPPVRIFLGTEPAQYRAERILFWSIERHRDPGRVYEIHLMSDLAGFDRKGWRTGFTKYRFAIPDLAGGEGRAIYNDVDQIYLADPALLFDLEMGGHGYLAISPEETSVMLIDCARMRPIWNRETANREGKHALIKKPAETPGLWGPCDPHWNARDNEYVEGLTKCLHYTALHQQPWQPFPGDYSYHPNPLAYIWHGLEREADAAGYQVFTRERPSPGFAAALGSNRSAPSPVAPLGAAAEAFRRDIAPTRTLLLSCGDTPLAAQATAQVDLARGDPWPDSRLDLVAMDGVLERVPPGDIAWLLDAAFALAGRAVLLRATATAPDGLGSAEWWQRRVEEAARRHPAVSWHLDVLAEAAEPARSFTARRIAAPPAPRVWALLDGDPAHEAQVLSLAGALGWPFERRRLRFSGRDRLPSVLRGASLAGLDPADAATLAPPWPDLVISAGPKSVPVARWLRRQAGKGTRLVQLGRPSAPFELFDLIVTTPQDRLPIRPNVLHVAAPLLAPKASSAAAPAAVADVPRPWTLLLVPGDVPPYALDAASAATLGRAASAVAAGGAVLLGLGEQVSSSARDALGKALAAPWRELEPAVMRDLERRRAALATADRVIVAAGDPQLLAEACLTGRPVSLFEPPRWYDSWLVARPLLRLLSLLAGGGRSYRGTPLQQHALSRLIDELTARGWIARPRDPALLHEALIARGLVNWLGGEQAVASPKPLDDLATVVERVRWLMAEAPAPAGA